MMTQDNSLHILHWNARSIRNKKHQLFEFLLSENIDVACLSETHLRNSDSCNLCDYCHYRLDRNDSNGGGVSILIRCNVPHSLLPCPPTKVIESVAVEILNCGRKLTLVSAYFPGSSGPLSLSDFDSDLDILLNLSSDVMICGDLNSKHSFWNCSRNNQSGQLLFQKFNQQDFLIYHPDSCTHFPSQNGSNPSTIDLILVKGSPIIVDLSVSFSLSSDHLPVLGKISGSFRRESVAPKLVKDYLNANWIGFALHLSNNIVDLESIHLDSRNGIDEAIQRFSDLVSAADEIFIPATVCNFDPKRLPPDIVALIGLRRAKKRLWHRTGDPIAGAEIKFLDNLIDISIRDWTNLNFSKSLESLNRDPGPFRKKFWRLTKFFKNRPSQIPVLVDGDQRIITDSEKANLFASHFSAVHDGVSSPSLNSIRRKVCQAVSAINRVQVSPNDVPIIDQSSLDYVLMGLSNNKAPGLDSISHRHLKHLPCDAKLFLLKIFNACLRLQYFPASWRIANVKCIGKSGRPLHRADSYRPISLLSCLGKIFERLILIYLNSYVEENRVIGSHQFGFQKDKSCVHQLLWIKNLISSELQSKKSIGMLALDLKNAFDTVWHDGLLFKLKLLNCPLYLIKLIQSFLERRSFVVTVNGTQSRRTFASAGVPQGSCLSPILFNIFISDIPLSDFSQLAQFADDTALLSSSFRTTTIIRRLQKDSDRLTKYFKKWRINLNPQKSESVLFSRKTALRHRPNVSLVVDNNDVEWHDHLKYLGIILDRRLTFRSHIDHVIAKIHKMIRALYPLINKNSKISWDNKILIFKTIFRPSISYACPVWIGCAKTQIIRLQRLQSKILKMMLNLHWRTSTSFVHSLAGVDLFPVYIQRLNENFCHRLQFNSNQDIQNLLSLLS